MKKAFLYIIIIALGFQSCDFFTVKRDDREVVARVHQNYLFKDELKNILPPGYSVQDSIQLTANYINNWVKQQLLLSKAQINLENNTEEFEELVKKYREDLYINSYREAVVSEYLNKEITSDDIDKYYAENSQNFKLNEELLQLKFIKIGKDVYDKKELIKLFKSKKQEDLEILAENELSLKSHHLNDSVWVKYNDLIVKVPLFKTIDKKRLLKKGAFFQKEDSLSLYLVTVKGVLERNQIAPESYVTPTIKQMILHQRKLLLLKNIEDTLIDDARKEQEFEIY